MPITGCTADARAFASVLLIQPNSQRHMERLMSHSCQVIMQLLNPRLVTHGRMRIRCAGFWIGGILASIPMDLVEGFRLGVKWFELVISDRPRRRNAAMMYQRPKILL